jgi:putative PEP-CTERM system histidine kinase
MVLALLPGPWLLFSLTYARGNAREFLAKWRLMLVAAFLLPVIVAVLGQRFLLIAVADPGAGSRWSVQLGWSSLVVQFLLLIGSVLVLTNLERTFRASVGTMRWRIKFMVLGVSVLFAARLYTCSQALLVKGIELPLQQVNCAALLVTCALALVSLYRTGRFHLDVYPSQSVLQGSLAVLLAGIYLLVVGVVAKLVAYFGGESGFTLSAFLVLVALVLLAILLQSDHARLRLRRFVSRNFQRPLYDYRTVWRSFTECTASRVEQTDLCRSLVRLLADMFQVLSVSLWLLDEDKHTLLLAASTSLSEANPRDLSLQQAETSAVIHHFQSHPEPADIEGSQSPWAVALRQFHPSEFPNGGRRICIPLLGRGELLGVITLGDRVGAAAYTLQDYEMLKCVGDHAAASLLNVQLAGKLVQAKELEAFQTMAAFFVHDLKNAASTLNLMLQNLPVHFDDPAFRADALRGLTKTGTHINRLIGRLNLLRHELKLRPAPVDLNALVTSALAGLGNVAGVRLVRDLSPVPKVTLDQEQIVKVLTNLVLNSTEAVTPGDGEVRVATRLAGDQVVLSVSDNGCGMDPKFVQLSLFRPFQSTKKNGMGIGMFQSKMIVEAHQGRIAVASEAGKGTTFQVFLPVAGRSP